MTSWLFSFFIFLFAFSAPSSFAAECIETNSSMSIEQLTEIQGACQQKIDSSRQEQVSLKQIINNINSKINLTQGQINQTQSQILAVEKEIEVLGGVLDRVNESTAELSKIYLARVRETYRRIRVNPSDLLFSTNNFGDYFTKLKYLNTVKSKDQLILSELEKSRQDYNSRRQSKQEKQQEIETLKKKMEEQKLSLSKQQKEKQALLTVTANDEKKFSNIMKQANSMIAAMKGFTSGATPLKNQTRCDGWGCYYNQRDSQWFTYTIGNSPETLGLVGCLITSSAMISSHYGKSLKPTDIAGSTNPFYYDTAYMIFNSWSVNGVTVNRTPISKDKIDDEVTNGRPVIAGLNTGDGTHFIVIKGKNDKGYIMNDPYMENGYDKVFTDTYSMGQVFRIDKVTIN